MVAHPKRAEVALAEGIPPPVVEGQHYPFVSQNAFEVGILTSLAAVRQSRIEDDDVALAWVKRLGAAALKHVPVPLLATTNQAEAERQDMPSNV